MIKKLLVATLCLILLCPISAIHAEDDLDKVNLMDENDGNQSIDDSLTTNVVYETHIQDIGWQGSKLDGQTAGTTGHSKRLEAIRITLENQMYTGGIEYSTHIQDIGWQGKKSNGVMSGTSGQSKRLEAIRINLTEEMADNYDIYYRVHAQEFGWLGWAKNGENAGTARIFISIRGNRN